MELIKEYMINKNSIRCSVLYVSHDNSVEHLNELQEIVFYDFPSIDAREIKIILAGGCMHRPIFSLEFEIGIKDVLVPDDYKLVSCFKQIL